MLETYRFFTKLLNFAEQNRYVGELENIDARIALTYLTFI